MQQSGVTTQFLHNLADEGDDEGSQPEDEPETTCASDTISNAGSGYVPFPSEKSDSRNRGAQAWMTRPPFPSNQLPRKLQEDVPAQHHQPIQAASTSYPVHPSRQANTGTSDTVFIGSSMFSGLDPDKMSSTSQKVHVFPFPGADVHRMMGKIQADAGCATSKSSQEGECSQTVHNDWNL